MSEGEKLRKGTGMNMLTFRIERITDLSISWITRVKRVKRGQYDER